MIVNNIDKIKKLLKFGENTYYFIQVIQRRRENPELPKVEIQRGYWYITSLKELDIHIPKIIMLCSTYNARAYISLVPRSSEKFAKLCVVEFSQRVFNNSYTNVFSVPQKVALNKDTIQSGIFPKPLWLLDIDKPGDLEIITDSIRNKTSIKIVETIDTVRGMHLIVECFNPKKELGAFIKLDNNNYRLLGKEEFTVIETCNTLLYAVTP